MSFPNINVNEPKGEWRVSEIDNAERLTRSWLTQCMQQISGYPDVPTAGVMGWTSNTRPQVNPNGNYLIGYNTQTGQLEVLDSNNNAIGLLDSAKSKKIIAQFIYPVGSYYWTNSQTFNPQTEWGGTWVRIRDGRCLISDNQDWGSDYAVDKTGGARTVELKNGHLPVINLQHVHGVGSYSVYGKIEAKDKKTDSNQYTFIEQLTYADDITPNKSTKDNALYMTNKITDVFPWGGSYSKSVGYNTIVLQADQEHGFSGMSGVALNKETHTKMRDSIGSGVAHNNMPPYRVGVLWLRTA